MYWTTVTHIATFNKIQNYVYVYKNTNSLHKILNKFCTLKNLWKILKYKGDLINNINITNQLLLYEIASNPQIPHSTTFVMLRDS